MERVFAVGQFLARSMIRLTLALATGSPGIFGGLASSNRTWLGPTVTLVT